MSDGSDSNDGRRVPLLPGGRNQNVSHGGRGFHVATEARQRPELHLVTHVFLDGAVVATHRWHCRAITTADSLRALLFAQHRVVVRKLQGGQYDERIAAMSGTVPPSASARGPWQVLPPGGAGAVLAGKAVPAAPERDDIPRARRLDSAPRPTLSSLVRLPGSRRVHAGFADHAVMLAALVDDNLLRVRLDSAVAAGEMLEIEVHFDSGDRGVSWRGRVVRVLDGAGGDVVVRYWTETAAGALELRALLATLRRSSDAA